MTNNAEQQNKVIENLSKIKLDTFVKIIDKLAGDKSNFKASFQELKFQIGETKVTLNGEVNLDFIHAKKTET